MSAKPKRVAPPSAKAAATLSGDEILGVAEGYRRLLKLDLPAVLSGALHEEFQAVKFAASPIEKARDATIARFTKKDRQGRPIPGKMPGSVQLRDVDTFNAEMEALLMQRHAVKLPTFDRTRIPETVDDKTVVVKGETWELLTPVLKKKAETASA